tara:strand:- start:8396 stop:12121 length:3726 start_codon:yes stop_codon:yes gene_type:complete
MSVKKFKFVSPGIFIDEIDNSQLPALPARMGPVIIGRTEKGPGMRPVIVNSFSEFVEVFGQPIPGGQGGDVWRDGNYTAPTYAGYAAQAWLRNNSPATIVRLLGNQHSNAQSFSVNEKAEAGWKTDNVLPADTSNNNAPDNAGGAYGLFVLPADFGTNIGNQASLASGTLTLPNGTSYAGVFAGLCTKGAAGKISYGHIGEEVGGILDRDTLHISVPKSLGGLGLPISIMHTSSKSGGSGGWPASSPDSHQIFVTGGSDVQKAAAIAAAINGGTTSAALGYSASYGSSAQGGIPGVSAAVSANEEGLNTGITLTADKGGASGNHIMISGSTSFFASGSKPSTHGIGVWNAPTGPFSIATDWSNLSGNIVQWLQGGANREVTGALGAIFYLNEGSIILSGTARDGSKQAGSGILIKSDSTTKKQFTARIYNGNGVLKRATTFNFDENSNKFIRKVFNTNPTLTNTDITSTETQKTYWLGESFEKFVADNQFRRSTSNATDTGPHKVTSGEFYGLLVGLEGSDTGGGEQAIQKKAAAASKSGWIISQDLRALTSAQLQTTGYDFDPTNADHVTKLFRFVSRETGEWDQKNIKISIQDIKVSSNSFEPYGSFAVVIRKIDDTDNAPIILERFSNCNLNPNSENFVARKIGDKYLLWDDIEKRYTEYGEFDNNSKYVYLEMNNDLSEAKLLPFGAYGHPRFYGWNYVSGNSAAQVTFLDRLGVSGSFTNRNRFVQGSGSIAMFAMNPGNVSVAGGGLTNDFIYVGNDTLMITPPALSGTSEEETFLDLGLPFTGSWQFPAVSLRSSSFDGNLASPKDSYWGADFSKKTVTRFERSNRDIVRGKPTNIDSHDGVTAGGTEYAWVFTLDDLKAHPDSNNNCVYEQGSRNAGESFTAVSASYTQVLDNGFDRFTVTLHGGSDGLDITEKDPFRNRYLDGGSELSNYAWYSVKKAIDSIKDPEVVEYDLALAPGITNEALTGHLLNTVENRGDALGLIDLKGDYEPRHESSDSEAVRRGGITTVVQNLNDRGLNTSYGAAYYPWVQTRDTIGGQLLWIPPTIAALGTLSSAQASTELWFAPAGFTRGGLTEGSAGIPIIGVREKLTSKQRDTLYEANINPIASFPAEGIVIFGQKTLQVTRSALDRINVRRLLIFLKKEISRIAATTLFDQNVQQTWARFTGQVVPFLEEVKTGLGLTEYKVILDETTTTPDLVDQNIMYAKILLKPARAIEYIALDFVITNSGASFED